jgi:hypothetical protein
VLLPKFTWHGFRFASVELSTGVTLVSIEAEVYQTPIEQVGNIIFGDDSTSDGAGTVIFSWMFSQL